MILKKSALFLAVLTMIISCSKSEKKTPSPPLVPAASGPVAPQKAEAVELPREFTAAKYSDGKWSNGIMKGESNRILITLKPKIANPIKAGYKLVFAAAGEATVLDVGRIDYPDYASLFVRVDRKLDPIGDGHPHPIRVKSFSVIPSAFSQAGVWEKGIHLKKTGVFFFALAPQESCPLKVGDRLRFAGAGEATVSAVKILAGSGNRSVLVTVDRPLDPRADGAPNPVQIIVTE